MVAGEAELDRRMMTREESERSTGRLLGLETSSDCETRLSAQLAERDVSRLCFTIWQEAATIP